MKKNYSINVASTIASRCYYYGTYPYRQLWMRSACAKGQAPIGVMLFHRIANDLDNCWTTSTSTFANVIRWLKDRCDLVSLEEVQRRIRDGRNERLCMSLTFDDGYADNCDFAIPLLLKERIPFTYFVTAGPVLEGVPFEHDLANDKPLAPNTVDQLRELVDAGIEIGAHSRTHADFGNITDRETLVDELVFARDELENAIGQRVRYFAFPFGKHANLSVAAFHLAKQAGYAGVCSAYGGYNMSGGDAFHLKRRGLDRSLLSVKNWVTIDPFRNRQIQDFDYFTNDQPLAFDDRVLAGTAKYLGIPSDKVAS